MAEVSDLEKQEIARYLKWGEKELFRELDRFYGASMPGGRRASYRLRGKGRAWFEELLPQLKQLVCQEWSYDAKKEDPQLENKEDLVVALGQALTPLLQRNPFPTKGQAPAYLVSAILVRMGLDKLCGEQSS